MAERCCFLAIDNIHACKTKSNCVTAECLTVNEACGQSASFKSLQAESFVANNICAQKVQAVESWSDKSYNNTLCAQSASIKNLCVTNLQVEDSELCNIYRASVTFNGNTLYTLGTPLNWDTILDNPDNDITLSPFQYKVAVGESGYYSLSFHLDTSNLSGADVISGPPIGLQTVLVNGNKLIDQQTPYLTFSNDQTANLSGLVLLHAGDVITMKYDVLVLTSSGGFTPYAGTVTIQANGLFPGQSSFTIIQLSTFCTGNNPVNCPPCPPVGIPCTPVTNKCDPVSVSCCDNSGKC